MLSVEQQPDVLGKGQQAKRIALDPSAYDMALHPKPPPDFQRKPVFKWNRKRGPRQFGGKDQGGGWGRETKKEGN